ncbi:Gfo/Idh/MocA family oxidoreductase [Gemmata sp. JC673]|uniref:Gfo/Idh/MocA family oxidoreductase n=1 Tax=Gemmata algarum TaxID=2975278 RepID=A0ABU5EZ36_9BACT|nr:Gfo/Idh/MocA family oxidoreductase [Gemmata algarum]MDY3560431.1 Gfo/Idh/MocA family oxidoreductase [Gemmata algarum]
MPHDLNRRGFIATSATLIASNTMRADAPPLAPPDKQPPNLKVPEAPAKTVGWAVVGLGQLALEEIMPAFAKCKLSRPVALVSGHPDKAKNVAAAYGIDPKNIYDYKTYDRLGENPAVDAIYIVLPNSMHAEYTVRGLKAGKHVLCEKPMAATVAECEQMIAAAKTANRKLMIAYRLRYEPFNMTAIEICRTGGAGKLKSITASNCQTTKAPNIRLSKALAGGPVQDVGIYCINAFRYLTGEEPTEVTATAHQPKDDPQFREVPESVSFTLRFPSGVVATGDCSFGTAESRRYRVQGSEGLVEMDPAFSYRGLRLNVQKGGQRSEIKLTEVDHFAAEMDHFSECVLANKAPRTPGEEGLADMRVIEAIDEATKTGRTAAVRS